MDANKHVTKRARNLERPVKTVEKNQDIKREPRRNVAHRLDQQETELEIREALRLGSGTEFLEDI